MTLCPQCGAALPEDEKCCPRCGAPLPAEEPETAAPAEISAAAPSPEEEMTPENTTGPEEEAKDKESPESCAEAGSEEEAAPESEAATEPQDECKPDARSEPEAEAAADEPIRPPAETAEEPEGKPESEPAPEPEPESEPEPEPKPEPEPEPRPEKKRRPRDSERGKRILRILGMAFTALGLLILLAAALVLIQMHRQQKELADAQLNGGSPVQPVRPQIINHYSRPGNDKIRQEGQIRYAIDELIVLSAPEVSYTDMERFFGERDMRVLGYVELMDLYQIRLPEGHTPYGLGEIARELEQEDCIALAVMNVLWDSGCYTLPEDPWGGSANWEKTEGKAANWALMAIHAPESWERWDTGTVCVGLIDLDFDQTQEDLRFSALRGGDSRSRAAAEEAGNRLHGCAVAAVIGAVPNNGLGLAGAAGDCLIDAVESGGPVGQMDALSAIADLTARDVRPIQLSLGWQEELLEQIADPQSRVRELYYEKPRQLASLALDRMAEKGWDNLLILPAGNGLQGRGVDAALGSVFAGIEEDTVLQSILVVGAAELDEENRLRQCAFSNLGQRLDLLAPGAEIYTVSPGGYSRRSGSSLAAAYVTAAAARAWALNPGLDSRELRELLVETADIAVAGSEKKLLNMTAALEAAGDGAQNLPLESEEEAALNAYAALLRGGVELPGRSGLTLEAQRYVLTDLDGNGVQELLVYALDEDVQNASFALYGMKDGQLSCLCNAWETCRFALWSNMSLTLEIQDGRHIYASAEKESTGYGQTGECFWIGYNGRRVSVVEYDRRQKDAEHLILIENSVLTEQGIRIGSGEDLLWAR